MKLSRGAMLLNAFEHQTHHRGQMTIYLRMKGITPPPEPS
ncbi:MAG TPA: DinB family protein [Blastocatellia bacterium]|nr:DinB family protein [Blastocatellia bacterium]